MTPLITMLEQADCGSPKLDGHIFRALNPHIDPARWTIFCGVWHLRDETDKVAFETPPPYSTSLDAALSALPEGWEYSITTVYGFVAVELPLNCGDHVPSVRVIRGDCNTALALITAILKATREGTE